MFKIRINASRTRRKLKKTARNARTLRKAFVEIGQIVAASIQKNFDAQGRPDRWKRRKDKKTHPILNLTGKLRKSIRRKADNSGVTLTATAPYGGFHQLGTSKMPARPFMVLQDKDHHDIAKAILSHLKGDFR